MKYINIHKPSHEYTLAEALLPTPETNTGVYIADRYTPLPKAVISNMPGMTSDETAYVILSSIFGRDVQLLELNQLVKSIFTFSYPINATERNHVYTIDVSQNGGLSGLDIATAFYVGLSKLISSPGHNPIFLIRNTDTFELSLCKSASEANLKTILLTTHDKAESAAHTLCNLSSNRIYAMALAGTTENRENLLARLLSDVNLITSKHLAEPNVFNPASVMALSVIYFSSLSPMFKLEPSAKEATLLFESINEPVLLAGLISRRLGLRIDLKVCRNAESDFTPEFRELLTRLDINAEDLTIDESEKNLLLNKSHSACPVVIVKTDNGRNSMRREGGSMRHNCYHIVRNYNSLKQQIEIIK